MLRPTPFLLGSHGWVAALSIDARPPYADELPSGPSFGATFDRDLIRSMANKVGVELRAMLALGDNKDNSWAHPSIDCWGPVVSSLNP